MFMDYLALDIETTGLSPEKDRIIEIGAVKYRGDKEMENMQPSPAKDYGTDRDYQWDALGRMG